MLFSRRPASHSLIKCPVCSVIIGDKTPKGCKSFYCQECHTTHFYSGKEVTPYKSIPDSLAPKQCSCPQCRNCKHRKKH